MHIYIHIHTHTHTHIHTYIHTYIRTYIHIYKGCPQGSHCGPGLWNIFYNSLLRLKFLKRTKVIAFANDILLLTRAKTVSEVENLANIELSKISAWARQQNSIQRSKIESNAYDATEKKGTKRAGNILKQ